MNKDIATTLDKFLQRISILEAKLAQAERERDTLHVKWESHAKEFFDQQAKLTTAEARVKIAEEMALAICAVMQEVEKHKPAYMLGVWHRAQSALARWQATRDGR